MERLTYRGENGKPYVRADGYYQHCRMNLDIVAERLAAYEDEEDQGRLVILPVKAGDTVYQLRDKKHALGVGVHPRHISCVCVYGNDWIAVHQGDKPCTKNDFGKTWFLSPEKAEIALAKLAKEG